MHIRTATFFFLLCAFLTAVGSCTVEKRLYNKGWHVSGRGNWNHQHSEAEKEVPTESLTIVRQAKPELQQTIVTDSSATAAIPAQWTDEEPKPSEGAVTALQPAVREHDHVKQAVTADQVKTSMKANKKALPRDRWTRKEKTTVMIGLLVLFLVCAALSITFLLLAISGATGFIAFAYIAGLIAVLSFIGLFLGLSIPTKKTEDDFDDDRNRKRDREVSENGVPRVTGKASGVVLGIFAALVVAILVVAAIG